MTREAPPLSIGEWLKIAVERLQGVSDSPQLDAEILLGAAAGIHRVRAHAWPETKLSDEQLANLQPLLERRARGEPIAYIVGMQEFWSLPLRVSPAVLIPRPETELLVERALENVPLNEPSRVLDLGTGSGAVALAIAQARPHARILAVDISPTALDIATENLNSVGVANLELRASDWFGAVRPGEHFDVIVANPPYIAEGDPALSPTVAAFEPRTALIAGPSGMEALQHIVGNATLHLRPQGHLLLEHGWQQAVEVRTLLVQTGFTRVRSWRDLAGHERVTEGQCIP